MHWKKCYILTLLKRRTGIAIEDLFSFITDIPMLISENSNSIFSSIFKGDLGNFKLGPSSPQTVHSSHHEGNVYCNIW